MDKRGFTPLERKLCPLGEHRKTFSLLRGGVKKYITRVWLKSHLSFLTGFTLIELLITVAIIGILAGVAVTAYVGTAKKAARAEAYTNLSTIRLLEENYFGDNPALGYAPAGGGTVPYRATPGVADTGLEDELTAFQPGGCTGCASPFGLNFTYAITVDVALVSPVAVPYDATTTGLTPCFVATATGVANSRVEGDVFAIDCNNIRNFQ